MTVDLRSLLERAENETLDFKARSYDLSVERKKRDFAKDLASLANTPRIGDAHIVLGVKKRRDGSCDLMGIDRETDDAELQSVASSLLEPTPRFVYQSVRHGDVVLGLITIPDGQQSPVAPKRDVDPGFVKGTIYFRRGSQNDVATMLDQRRIWDWFRDDGFFAVPPNPYASQPAWIRYLEEVNQLSLTDRHVLILDDRFKEDAGDLIGAGAGPWGFVFDFDTSSDNDGLLHSMKDTLDRHRALHIRVKGDPQTSRSPDFTTTWFFVRGLEGRADSIPHGATRDWRRMYRQILRDECDILAAELAPATVHVTILWRDDEFSEHLAEVLRCLDDSLHDAFKPVFVTDAPASCESLADEFDAQVIEMPLKHFADGVQHFIEDERPVGSDIVAVPSASGVEVQLDNNVANWIAEEIELLPLITPPSDDVGNFLRGGTLTWADLDRNVDAQRDIQARLTEAVRRDLEAGRTTRFNLFHRPGAGGTTVGRRTAWELHDIYPTGLLRRTNPIETSDRIARLYELTESPTLLIADGNDIADRELDELAEHLGARRTPVVLVQVRRRQSAGERLGERSFDLDSMLSTREVSRFVYRLSQDAPDRASAIEWLADVDNRALHRPVYFALTAYERDFRALSDFVRSRITTLDEDQKRVVVFAAIALRYGQRALPANSFRDVFGLTSREKVDLTSLFPTSTGELFVETAPGEWRIGHSLVAEELLKQLLASGGDIRTWQSRLPDWGIQFIQFCRGDIPIPSDEMLDLVRRVFVYRENLDVLGREQSGHRRFAHFIEDIRVSESRLRVLNSLVQHYPTEHHFWAHLARFYAMDRKDYTRALEAADRAVEIADNDSVVFHMRGMVRRYQLRELRRSGSALDELVAIAEKASTDFERSRSMNPENEHAYIAEAQMHIELLEHVSRSAGDLFQYLTRPNVPPYVREALDRVEDLLAHVQRDREGVGASQFETRASARAHALYGNYSDAIQKLDSLIGRPDVFQPPIRRQLAWAYLARAEGDWSRVPKRNVARVVALLGNNLEEEVQPDQSIRLWMQASRFQESPPTVESVFEQVQYWRAEPGSVDAAFYAYVLNALMVMDGSRLAVQRYEQYLSECRELTRFRRNRDRSFEWLGSGTGIGQLVHQSRLGDWNREVDFWENIKPLTRASGRVARINGPQAGLIELAGGLRAFFVPAKSGLLRGSENTPVSAFVGFSYDGLRAWDVARHE